MADKEKDSYLNKEGVAYLWEKIVEELKKKAAKESLNNIAYSDDTDTIILDGGCID